MKLKVLASTILIGIAATAQPPAADTTSTLFLVRHAERTGTQLTDPIMEGPGKERARLLARMFGEAGISKIFVSNALRTQQTAAPLAAKLGIKPEIIDGGDTPRLAAALAAVPAGSTVFAARHSGEIEKLIEVMGGGQIPKMPETEYDRLLIVTLAKGKVLAVRTLRYGTPTSTSN
jgi:phosphohistidine phosphatase SixA